MGWVQFEHVYIFVFCWFGSYRGAIGTIFVCVVGWDSSLGCINTAEPPVLLPRINEWMNDKRVINIHVLRHLDFNLFSNYEMMIDGDCACIRMRWDSPLSTWQEKKRRKKKSLSE